MSKVKKNKYKKILSSISIAILALGNGGALSAEDKGWYLTRTSPYQANSELNARKRDIRDLVTDCSERMISLSCHRAGVWFLTHKLPDEGIKYIKTSCELGRGYSCRVAGDMQLKAYKKSKERLLEYRASHSSRDKNEKAKEKEMYSKSYILHNEVKYLFTAGCFRKDKKSCQRLGTIPSLPQKNKEEKSSLKKVNDILEG